MRNRILLLYKSVLNIKGWAAVMINKSTTKIMFWISGEIRRVTLYSHTIFFFGGGVHYGNVPVENNANRFLFHKANGPIFIHGLRSHCKFPAKNAQSAAQSAPLCGSCSVISGLPHKTVHHFQNLFCSSPSPHPVQSWNSEKILDTCIQLCLGGEGRGWACMNWKTPQKCKSIPRLMSVIVWKRGGMEKVNFQWFSSL